MFSQINYEVGERIATITLNRPEKLNAFTNTMLHEIISALDMSDADDDVRAVVVTGAGRAFCAGADLSSGGETFSSGGSDVAGSKNLPRDGGGLVALRIFESKKPVIGAINGAAVGVGVTMTLPMDIRLAGESAKFGFVFARRGIITEACSSWFLPRVVGISRAAEWVYTGRMISPSQAAEAGLVRSVHRDAELLDAAREIAREIAENTAPVSVALSRQMLWRMLGAAHPMEAHRAESRGILQRGRSADAREGVTSFLEKRAANFVMKVSTDTPNLFPEWQDPEFR
ncbi:MAG: crotonase/enoyl-CoA hydratase family protein [Actinomycetota bacterium]